MTDRSLGYGGSQDSFVAKVVQERKMGTATNSPPVMKQSTWLEANWLAVPDFSRPLFSPRAVRKRLADTPTNRLLSPDRFAPKDFSQTRHRAVMGMRRESRTRQSMKFSACELPLGNPAHWIESNRRSWSRCSGRRVPSNLARLGRSAPGVPGQRRTAKRCR